MSGLDWFVLTGTLAFIVIYGIWRSRGSKDLKSYLLANQDAKWWTVGLSVMATQASAITFLSTPGQAFNDGMGFVQFYFGLPLAMVVICYTFIPIYHKLKVFTAYEYLESRFDVKTRSLAACLFLIQRGLAAGITIYAPAIILSSILGWNLNITTIATGVLVILYTVSGGTKAVSITQKQQMLVILLGMIAVFYVLLDYLPNDYSFSEILSIAGANGKMDIIDFSFDMNNRYTVWSGITGGFFLALSYFGTDQSQVQRYLTGRSVRESRLGLVFNGLLKVPMQFFILLCGVLVFVFYQYHDAPIFFNIKAKEKVYASNQHVPFASIERQFQENNKRKIIIHEGLVDAKRKRNADKERRAKLALNEAAKMDVKLRTEAKEIIAKVDPDIELNDKDYVFISFILQYMPKGLIGLLIAMILCAAMSSTASELNALASTTTVDIFKRSIKPNQSDAYYTNASKMLTVLWGCIAIGFASVCTLFENLIQFVNIIGSIFYGTVLGIFLVAFYLKFIKSRAVFVAAVIVQIFVIYVYWMDWVSYLWLNVIGCFGVIILASLLQVLIPSKNNLDLT